MNSRRAAFLDRDGTIIQEAHYLADPDGVVLVPGAAAAMRRLADAGYALVVVTNQSGIARGLYSDKDFHAVQQRLEALLRAKGVALDGVFYCPHHPEYTGPCECRKPGLGMYRSAAEQLGVSLAGSIFVGDRAKDVLPALQTGGRGFLVRTGYGAGEAAAVPAEIEVLADLRAVVERVLQGGEQGDGQG